MEWLLQPISGFDNLDEPLTPVSSDCGSGGTLNSCACTGGLVVCGCTGCLKTGS